MLLDAESHAIWNSPDGDALDVTPSPVPGATPFLPDPAQRYRAELAAFENAFDSPDIAVSAFMAGDAAHVDVIDIEQRLPDLFTGL